jgi:pimeloyl-ACP methyl ester carboxylesterase
MSTPYLPLHFDVTDQVRPLKGSLQLAAWLFVPPSIEQQAPLGLLFCLPGGSYTKAYYHLEVEGYPLESYSFALAMARRGFLVIVLDHLGVGESTHPADDMELTVEVIAQANALVVEQVRTRLAAGSLSSGVPQLPHLPVIGVGHSLGAQLALIQQAHFRSFDALSLLGWTNQAISYAGTEQDLASVTDVETDAHAPAAEVVNDVIRFKQDPAMMAALRAPMHPFFFLPDVPPEVIAADDALAVPIPVGITLAASDPGLMPRAAATIHVPLFLSNGVIDVSTNVRTEAAGYTVSPDITLFTLAGSAHCHNFAATRGVLWQRLANWAEMLGTSKASRVVERETIWQRS